VIDITKLRDYKWCSRGILVAVFRYGSRWFRSEFRCSKRSSALDGVLKPSSPLTGSIGADWALGRVWRMSLCRRTARSLGALGVLAFLLSAVLPDDDAFQQEFAHSRASRVVGGHNREANRNASSAHLSTAFWPTAKAHLVCPCGLTYPLYFAPVPGRGNTHSTTHASRAPPASF
jgi:hypothetical protein